jgi:uncharacterized protein YggE
MKILSFIVLAILSLLSFAAQAQEVPRPQDDRITFDLSAEDWVTTKTAHVIITVEAAVSGNNAGSMRADMAKAVNDLAKSDWRLTSFNRSQDQTGLERWSANFETRLPENQLNGLGDTAKKASKAGMQLTVNDIDFSPTIAEMEAARAAVRTQIYKDANDQLAALNAAMPGRTYRISWINFGGDDGASPLPHVMRGPVAMGMMMKSNASADAAASQPMERAEKVTLTAHVVYAAIPPLSPAPPPSEPKHQGP